MPKVEVEKGKRCQEPFKKNGKNGVNSIFNPSSRTCEFTTGQAKSRKILYNKTMPMNSKTIVFITNNLYKFQIAKTALRNSRVKLVQKKLDVPEIQNESVEKIAAFSARWASTILKKSVIVSDAGCYIEALNGFPGPFIKYVNQWLCAQDLLRIMYDKKNRRVVWKDCLAYCEPSKEPVTFVSYFKGKLARKAGKNPYRKNYSWTDTLFIPEGFTKLLSELSTKEYLQFWGNTENYDSWKELLKYLRDR